MSLLHSLSTSIHKAMYIQSGDPGAVGAKVMWIDTTSVPYPIKRRDDTNTGWDTLGYLASDSAVASGSIVSALDFKQSVRAATTANITLSGAQTIDGVSVIAGDRVLVKDQSTGSQNGIYVAASGAWIRATDADTSAEVTGGMVVPVSEGTANGNVLWMLTTNDSIVLGSTALVFSAIGSGALTTIAPLVIESANVVAQRNGVTSQRLNIYDNYTDASNNAGLAARFDGSFSYLETFQNGSVTAKGLQIKAVNGNLSLYAAGVELRWDGSALMAAGKDLGTSGSRFSNLWVDKLSPQSDSPAQITANQNNYNPGTQNYIQRWTSDAARDVTGFNPGGVTVQEGQMWIIINVGSNNITIKHESASSTAANRFLTDTAADIILGSNQAIHVHRDVATQRYRVYKFGGSGGGTPGGSTTQVQYNNAGAFAGSAKLVWDESNGFLKIDGSYLPQVNNGSQLGSATLRFDHTYTNELDAESLIRIRQGWQMTEVGANGGSSSILKLSSNTGVGLTWGSPRLTPSQITSNQNDYNPGGQAFFVKLSSDASRNITGYSPATFTDGELHLWFNDGSFPIVIKHQDTNSVAQNRFINSTGTDIYLGPGEFLDLTRDDGANRWRTTKRATEKVSIGFAASDESTALTTGTGKVTFRMPHAMFVTEVRASLVTAQASGSIFTVDVNESGSTILSTKITIDNTEKTSKTAATPSVLSDTLLGDDAEITVDIDQVGDGTAAGLKLWIIGIRL